MAEKDRIAIVGAGPAGLSAAAHAATIGVSHILLEKDRPLSPTPSSRYQRGKYVMATPAQLVLRADLGNSTAGYREAILEFLEQRHRLGEGQRAIQRRRQVDHRRQGRLHLSPSPTATPCRPETVVLGIGLQGNPNLMRCPGGDLPHGPVPARRSDEPIYRRAHLHHRGRRRRNRERARPGRRPGPGSNVVSIVNRSADFARAKEANVSNLTNAWARDAGRVSTYTEGFAHPGRAGLHHPGGAPDGELRLKLRSGSSSRLGASAAQAGGIVRYRVHRSEQRRHPGAARQPSRAT